MRAGFKRVKVKLKRKISIMCLQETKWVGLKAKDSGTNRMRNGVGIIVDKTLT